MDLRQIEAFVAVCDERSFTAAAQRCGIAQSALSGRIAELEKAVGSELIDRSVRPVATTAAGDAMLPHARAILDQLTAAVADVKRLEGRLRGQLRLGMINVAGLSAPVIEQALAFFHSRHPAVEIVINDPSSRGIVEGIQRGQFDLGFVGYRRNQVPQTLAHQLLADRLVVAVVARSHPLARASSVSLEQLAHSGPSIELRRGTGLRLEVDTAFAQVGATRTSVLDVTTTDEAVRYAAYGFGFALVPDSALAGRRPGGSISVLNLNGGTPHHPVALIHQRPGPKSLAAVEYVSVLRSLLDETQPTTPPGK